MWSLARDDFADFPDQENQKRHLYLTIETGNTTQIPQKKD